jgi:hypothetical protein
MRRPTWKELSKAQKAAAFAMNQDNFEQNGLRSMADEWEEFKECFDDMEWAGVWDSLNSEARKLVA